MSDAPHPPGLAPDAAADDGGHDRFAENIMHFGRVLRRAGLPVGTGRILDAIRAVEVAGIRSRHDFYWTLHAVFVSRREHREIFDQAFHVFWRNPKILERMMGMLLPRTEGGADDQEQQKRDISRRLAEALYPDKGPQEQEGGDEEEELEIDASFTWSARERLQTMDFESMSTEELALALDPYPRKPGATWPGAGSAAADAAGPAAGAGEGERGKENPFAVLRHLKH